MYIRRIAIKQAQAEYRDCLELRIENGKLIDLVARKEMKTGFVKRYFSLYGFRYEPDNPRHSAPVYTYFLPAQAAQSFVLLFKLPDGSHAKPVNTTSFPG